MSCTALQYNAMHVCCGRYLGTSVDLTALAHIIFLPRRLLIYLMARPGVDMTLFIMANIT